MGRLWKAGAVLACIGVICGGTFFWFLHKKRVVERDLARAAALYHARAEQGDMSAQDGLGTAYYEGKGVPQDYSQAAQWYRKAAKQNDAAGLFHLGSMYYQGKGVPQDYAEAARLVQRAGEQGFAKAQYALGLMYYQGQGVPKDYAEAVRWYRKAAEQGYMPAENALAYAYHQGTGVPQDFSEAARRYRRAADAGNARSQYDLGVMYDEGKGVPRNHSEAVRWYVMAARQGDALAQHALVSEKNNLGTKEIIWLVIAAIAGVFFSIEFLLTRKSLRTWPARLTFSLGICCLCYVGLSVYAWLYPALKYSPCANAFYLVKGFFMGMGIVLALIFVSTNQVRAAPSRLSLHPRQPTIDTRRQDGV